jgi:hypothetical protein
MLLSAFKSGIEHPKGLEEADTLEAGSLTYRRLYY